jgi:ketosteroid isomerase-like protein
VCNCEQRPCAAAVGHTAPPWLTAFYGAYLSSDPARLDVVLDDKVTWLLAGPAERVDFFGMRRGKAEVIELITRIMPCYQKLTGFDIEHLLIQDDQVAAFGRVCASQRETGRAIRFAFVHFMRFRDGKLISMRALADSFDALEQLMGCRIALRSEAGLAPIEDNDEVSAV